MKIVAYASPNRGPRPKGTTVDCIVLHCDAADHAQKSISWIRAKTSKVSYHVLVDRNGTVYRFVESNDRAWHAGKSVFEGRPDCNEYSIGLAFANNNKGEPYPDVQLAVGAAICAAWMRVHPAITLDRITTHAHVRAEWLRANPGGTAEVKTDPAPPFDLETFRAKVRMELEKPAV